MRNRLWSYSHPCKVYFNFTIPRNKYCHREETPESFSTAYHHYNLSPMYQNWILLQTGFLPDFWPRPLFLRYHPIIIWYVDNKVCTTYAQHPKNLQKVSYWQIQLISSNPTGWSQNTIKNKPPPTEHATDCIQYGMHEYPGQNRPTCHKDTSRNGLILINPPKIFKTTEISNLQVQRIRLIYRLKRYHQNKNLWKQVISRLQD